MTKSATESSLPALLEAMARLTPEERAQLQQRGAVLPHFGKSIDSQAKYGYRCKHCGKVGLEFIGEQFDNGGGVLVDKPPMGLRFSDLPWAQPKLKLEQINRATPRCQFCLTTLPHSNGYGMERYVVEVALYESSRDKAFENLREFRKKGNKNQASHNPDGTPITLSTNYDADDAKLIAATRARQEAETPGITAAVEEMASKLDLTNYLAKGPSGTRGGKR